MLSAGLSRRSYLDTVRTENDNKLDLVDFAELLYADDTLIVGKRAKEVKHYFTLH